MSKGAHRFSPKAISPKSYIFSIIFLIAEGAEEIDAADLIGLYLSVAILIYYVIPRGDTAFP